MITEDLVSIGMDPGAKYTGISVRDLLRDELLLSSTYVKPADEPMFAWGKRLGEIIQNDIVALFPNHQIGIEGIAAPRGFSNGKKSPINPKYVIFAAIVAGMLAQRFPDAVIVPPGHNGTSRAGYPDALNGRRPKDLPGIATGAGTRNHEKSAYDIAGEVPMLLANGYELDEQKIN